jgi:hypothetical protein
MEQRMPSYDTFDAWSDFATTVKRTTPSVPTESESRSTKKRSSLVGPVSNRTRRSSFG